MCIFVAEGKYYYQNEELPLSGRYITKSQPTSGSNGSNWNWLDSTFVLSDLEIAPTEDDEETAFDDKAVEGGQKPVCYEGATSYKSGTIFEELAERAKEEVEVHIPEVLPREELIEEAKAEAKADFSRFLYLS